MTCCSRLLSQITEPLDCPTNTQHRSTLFCSGAVLDPRVGHTMDVLSPFISVLCHSDWLFHAESCPRLDVVHTGRAWSSSPACTWHCSLHYLFITSSADLIVPVMLRSTMGDRAIAGSRARNSLPDVIRHSSSLATFKHSFKNYFYVQCFH